MVRELPNELDLSPTGDTTAHLLVFRPTIGFVPCSNTATLPLGNRAEDVIAFLAHDRAVTLGPPVATRLGDADTTMVNVTLGSGCGAMPEQRLFLIWSISGATLESNGDDVTLPIISGHRTELFVTEVVGQAFVIALDSRAGSFDAFAVAARSLLSTLEFVR
jgi:hypothetical protein